MFLPQWQQWHLNIPDCGHDIRGSHKLADWRNMGQD
jgi:hypothetical protein